MARPKGSRSCTPGSPPDIPHPPPPPLPTVSVVIPHVTDPYLPGTCRDILATAPAAEVIVVQDGAQPEPQGLPASVRIVRPWERRHGVGASRDAGIAVATGQTIVCMDAHTRPLPGWLGGMIAVLDRDETAIAVAECGICQRKGEPAWEWSDPSRYETGARMLYQTPLGYPLEPDWMRGQPAGAEIQLALGGTYAFRKARYNAIGMPWRDAIGWGTSEQTLCMVNWFLGGKTVVADAKADHIIWSRLPDGRPAPKPYPSDPATAPGAFYNRLRLLDIMPIPEGEKRQLTAAVMFHATRWGAEAWRLLVNRRQDSARDAMSLAVRTWDEWCAIWWGDNGHRYIQPRLPTPYVIERQATPRLVVSHGKRRVVGAGNTDVHHAGIRPMQPEAREFV